MCFMLDMGPDTWGDFGVRIHPVTMKVLGGLPGVQHGGDLDALLRHVCANKANVSGQPFSDCLVGGLDLREDIHPRYAQVPRAPVMSSGTPRSSSRYRRSDRIAAKPAVISSAETATRCMASRHCGEANGDAATSLREGSPSSR